MSRRALSFLMLGIFILYLSGLAIWLATADLVSGIVMGVLLVVGSIFGVLSIVKEE